MRRSGFLRGAVAGVATAVGALLALWLAAVAFGAYNHHQDYDCGPNQGSGDICELDLARTFDLSVAETHDGSYLQIEAILVTAGGHDWFQSSLGYGRTSTGFNQNSQQLRSQTKNRTGSARRIDGNAKWN